MEGNQNNKIGFFKRLKKAIFELEDYGYFLGEKLTVAFKYFFKLMLLISIVVTFAATYESAKMYDRAYDYIKNELPNFEFSDNTLKCNEYAEGFDHEFNFRIIINTDTNLNEDTIKEYKKKIKNDGNGILLLKDKAIYMVDIAETDIVYSKMVEGDTTIIETIKNKDTLINNIEASNLKNIIIITIFILQFVSILTANIIYILSDVCLVAIFGWIAAKICGVNFKMNPMIALSIYSLSLSIVLQCIYKVALLTTGFYIEYFQTLYLLIAYVYIIAAIFMIKYDLIKQTEELQKIIEVQKQVKKEIEEENREKQEKKEEDKKQEKEDDDVTNEEPLIPENREPDGSEI